jgi:hypothetical protein
MADVRARPEARQRPAALLNDAIHRPSAMQMKHVRALIESRLYLSRVPDLSLVTNPLDRSDRIAATRGDGYALIYSAQGRKFTVVMDKLGAAKLVGHWYNPRSETSERIGDLDRKRYSRLHAPS